MIGLARYYVKVLVYISIYLFVQVNTTATFKFVVSSVPFTSLWGADALTDAWRAYPEEKAAILNALHSVPNVVILSGDRHEFAAVERRLVTH